MHIVTLRACEMLSHSAFKWKATSHTVIQISQLKIAEITHFVATIATLFIV